jgi:AraC-like DNA-binding protein
MTQHKQELVYWRDGALAGACLASARYVAHEFDRHVHYELVIVMTEDGAGQCHTRAGSDVSGPGTVRIFGAGEYHWGKVWEGRAWNYRAIYLDMQGLAALSAVFNEDSRDDKPLFVPPGLYRDPQLSRLLIKAHASLEKNGKTPMMERQANWWAAMGMLFGRYGQPRPVVEVAGREAGKMAQVRDYIAAHYDRDVPVDELASHVNLSRFHLIRSFCKEFGLPPHAYASQVRLIAAKQLLATGQKPADAAAAVGLYDQSHLNRLFKRAYGITPGVYAALRPEQ